MSLRMWHLIAVACCAARGWASDPSLCLWVDERVRLGGAVKLVLSDELRSVIGDPALCVRFSSESARPEGRVVIVNVRATPPAKYAGALGLAVREGTEIRPVLEIYTQPVLRLLGSAAAPQEVGRALGRVLAHELTHYTSQRSDHDASGVFAACLGARRLTAQ